jgi:hypothetical protein
MVTTPELIALLAEAATPIRPLRPPTHRALAWLAIAAGLVVLLSALGGLRSDLGTKLQQPAFLLQIAASLVTGITAAIAAFHISLPDRSWRWLALPAPGLSVWISVIGYGCLTAWVALTPGSIGIGPTLRCFATVILTSLPLSLLLLIMLRHAADIRPLATAVVGGLAVAAITATALSLLHELDATILVLVWSFGLLAVFAGGAALGTRRIFFLAGALAHGR